MKTCLKKNVYNQLFKYNQDIIIENMLKTRANQVRIFERLERKWTRVNRLQDNSEQKEIEFHIIEFIK